MDGGASVSAMFEPWMTTPTWSGTDGNASAMRARVPSSSSSSSTTSSASRSSWRALKFGLWVSVQAIRLPAGHLALVGELGPDAARLEDRVGVGERARVLPRGGEPCGRVDRAQRIEPRDHAAQLGQQHAAPALADRDLAALAAR